MADESNTTVYVSNLHEYVNDAMLKDIFSSIGPVAEVKILTDKTKGGAGSGFIKFEDHRSAAVAVGSINGRLLYTKEVRVAWAHQGGRGDREDITGHHQIFVGNLSPEVDDATLLAAFRPTGSVSEARVMLDHATQRSKGFGFVAYRDLSEAERAIEAMTGATVGQWKVRCGWAHHRAQAPKELSPEEVDAADPTSVNVYVGNVAPEVTEEEVRTMFAEFGPIESIKVQRSGYAFVVYLRHEDAVKAIVARNGKTLGGKPIKCAWGRHQSRAAPATAPPAYPQPGAFGYASMMGQPQQPAPYQHGYSMPPTAAPQVQHPPQQGPMGFYGQPALSAPPGGQGPVMSQWQPQPQFRHPIGQTAHPQDPQMGPGPAPFYGGAPGPQPGGPQQYGMPQPMQPAPLQGYGGYAAYPR